MRHNLRVLAATELPENDREAGRTEVLPVQWRKHLRLDVRPLPPRLLPWTLCMSPCAPACCPSASAWHTQAASGAIA